MKSYTLTVRLDDDFNQMLDEIRAHFQKEFPLLKNANLSDSVRALITLYHEEHIKNNTKLKVRCNL